MEIFINRKPVETGAATTLAEVLRQQGIPTEGVAVAVDNRVVARSEWAAMQLKEGLKITVIRAVCGG